MPVKSVPWKWSTKRESAAVHCAEDNVSDLEICRLVGIDIKTLYDWRKRPEFQASVDELVAAYRKRIRIVTQRVQANGGRA